MIFKLRFIRWFGGLGLKVDLLDHGESADAGDVIEKTSKEIEKSSNDQNKNTENKTSKSNINAKIYKVQCFNYVTPLVIIILGSLLITYIIILFYQRNMVSSSYKGFLVF